MNNKKDQLEKKNIASRIEFFCATLLYTEHESKFRGLPIMKQLTPETIKKLTELCRIDCTPEEEASLLKDLDSILGYIALLDEVETTDVPPCIT